MIGILLLAMALMAFVLALVLLSNNRHVTYRDASVPAEGGRRVIRIEQNQRTTTTQGVEMSEGSQSQRRGPTNGAQDYDEFMEDGNQGGDEDMAVVAADVRSPDASEYPLAAPPDEPGVVTGEEEGEE